MFKTEWIKSKLKPTQLRFADLFLFCCYFLYGGFFIPTFHEEVSILNDFQIKLSHLWPFITNSAKSCRAPNILIAKNVSQKTFSHLKLSEGWMFLKVKISDKSNNSLNLAEAKFYKVGLAPPCLL